jgi:alkylation response protein AidB-like acyl-CoA dehydrogenase
MSYRAPLPDLEAALAAVGAGRLAATEAFADSTAETATAILGEAGRIAAEVLAPLRRTGDRHPCRLENGRVLSPPGFADGYAALRDGGWVGMASAPEHGGMGLPLTLAMAVMEMMHGANLALALNPLLTQGQIEAIERHAGAELRARYLPKLVSGQWTGTMNLTEPAAGSDVGALRAQARANTDGSYAVSGQKIYISWGDHDMAENIVHLVLARLPDGGPGTRGISLFLVPKYLPDAQGRHIVPNRLRPISLEHKMGLHGSPTCVMEYDGATGWIIGPEHSGMQAMFTMMNHARLAVGMQGVGVAEAATQKALAFAAERRQGRSPIGDGTGPILDHADVRRMLMTMRVLTASARAICLDCALSIDMSRAAASPAERTRWAGRAALLTPIAKAFGTEAGVEVASLGIQVHGGMGYVEETGAAQLYRDVRVTPIYEGTNGIQAMDLVGRKMTDGGQAALAVLAEVRAALGPGQPELTGALAEVEATTRWMLAAPMNDRFAGATPYLRAFALTLGSHHLNRMAAGGDPGRVALARFHARQLLPQVTALCLAAREGAAPLYAEGALSS